MLNMKKYLLAGMIAVSLSGAAHANGTGHEHHMSMESSVGAPAAAGAVVNKTVTVHLTDAMQLNFSDIPVMKAGDVVKFIVVNKGKIAHEFSVGTTEEQTAHREMMKTMPGMKHEDGSMLSVEPGKTKEMVWKFAGTGKIQFACNVPGHFEAGMHKEAELK